KAGGIRNAVEVPFYAQEARQRAYIRDLEDGVEAQVTLHAEREVVDGWSIRINLHAVQRERCSKRRAHQVGEVVDVAVVDGERLLEGSIAHQVAAGGSAAGTRRMIDAAHATQHRLAAAGDVECKTNARFEIHREHSLEPGGRIGIALQRDAVQRI